jgi:hypothetical protein
MRATISTSPSLSRSSERKRRWGLREHQLPASRILSVSDGGSLEEAFREGTLARHQAERELISSSTKMGLARKKATGTKLGNPHIKELSPKGNEAWKQETHSRSKDIAKVILKMGWPQAVISNGYLANELNHRGLLTGHGMPFDPRRVAGPRKSAEDLLRRAQEGVHGRKAAGAACCSAQTGPVALSCRPKCSFKPPFVQKRPGFSSPMLSGGGADYRSR